ncbi:ATP-binding protein [Vineibacter terrae]|uniref:ATP-binding protein n=1 Tax=Vineibacter terrae TaxID=2586908 RepID=UPI0015B66A6E|nr:ATP-binding protein [Vineibacter terrae]
MSTALRDEDGDSPDAAAPPAARHRRTITGILSRWLWYDRSVRTQLLGTFVVINLVAGFAAAVIVIYNGQRAIEAELAASVDVAERFVRGTVSWLARDTSRTLGLDDLAVRLRHPRHVRILVIDADGRTVSPPPGDDADGAAGPAQDAAAPAWFQALVQVDNLRRDVPVVVGGQHVGTIVVVGQAADEITEIWQDASGLALLALILNATVFAVLYVALGRVLHPLTSLAGGLRALEQGQLRHRLRRPAVRELADIAGRFNALADSIAAARTDNARLNRHLVTVQDDERRQIAMELHDELGPCLFGLKANVASIDRLARELPMDAAQRIHERVASIGTITDRMRVLNRDLLGRLRPMALGHVPLADAIASLVADFEGKVPDRCITFEIGRVTHSYGNGVDLTVFRCVQEGITNAARHAGAATIAVTLAEQAAEPRHADDAMPALLLLSVRDDGHGIAPDARPGLGWRGMEERVRALGGRLTLVSEPNGGTRLDVAIPIEAADTMESMEKDHATAGDGIGSSEHGRP